MTVLLAEEPDLSAQEFIDVLRRSTLAERRPVDESDRMAKMLANSQIVLTARDDGMLVGVSRSITDFAYCTYLSDLAVDAAYNAAELAAKALILCKQDDLLGSDGGIVSTFGQLYVKTQEVNKSIGRELNRTLQLRNLARYKPDSLLNKQDAEALLKLAEELITTLSDKINAL